MMNAEPVVLERTYNAPSDAVWQALTDHAKLKQWYFALESFKPEVGFEFTFSGGTETKTYLHLCKITEVIPGKKLAYTWRYAGYPGNTLVTFELFPEGDKTRLRLTHSGHETFPADNPDFDRKNFLAGWTEIIGNNLRKFVEV